MLTTIVLAGIAVAITILFRHLAGQARAEQLRTMAETARHRPPAPRSSAVRPIK